NNLAGATVTVVDAFTRETVASGVTGADGTLTLVDLPEGTYDYEVKADHHDANRAALTVIAGTTVQHTIFLRSAQVTYNWSVVPVPVEDRYRVVIENTFRTGVPAPVVTIEPGVIDLADVVGNYAQVDLKIVNHGLIAANNVRLEIPSHPLWELTPLVSTI